VGKYGLQMLVTSDAGLQKYLQQVLTQLSEWLYAGSVQKLVLVITSLETQTVRFAQERAGDAGVLCGALALTRLVRGHVCVLCVCVCVCVCVYSSLGAWMQVLERWNFDIETDGSSVQKPDMEHEKSEKVWLAKCRVSPACH